MTTEIEEYLNNLTNILSGQLRGAINEKARVINKELIGLTLLDAFETGKDLGIRITTEEFALQNLKNQLDHGQEE